MYTEQQEAFFAAVVSELFVTVERELENGLQTGLNQIDSLTIAFEQLYRRMDFDNATLAGHHTAHWVGEKYCMQATTFIMFGNYLARKGIVLGGDILDSDQ